MSDEIKRTTPEDEMDLRRRMMGYRESKESQETSDQDDPFARMRAAAYEEDLNEDDPFAKMRAAADEEALNEDDSYEDTHKDVPETIIEEPVAEKSVYAEAPVEEEVAVEEASPGSLYSRLRAASAAEEAKKKAEEERKAAQESVTISQQVAVPPVVEEPVLPEEKEEEEVVAEAPITEETKTDKKTKAPKVKGMRTYQQRQDRAGYAFMLPWIIGFVIFTLFPFVMTVYLSFTNVKSTILGYEIKWTGLSNYQTAFFSNESFVPALLNYLKMIVPYTFIVVVLSFIIAYLLNKINFGKSILRTIYFLPVIIMSGPVMSQLLSVQDATAANAVTGETVNPYSNIFIMQIIDSYSPALANGLASVFGQLSIILWFTGIPIVLFINGLQKINPSIYEAAKIDSANAWQIMWKITIPMVKETGLIITVFTIIQLGMYNSINPVYKLIEEATSDTNGGLGFAATYSWIYSVVALLIIGVVFLLFKDRKPKDIKARQKQEKKLKKLEKQQQRRLAAQRRHQKKEARLYGK